MRSIINQQFNEHLSVSKLTSESLSEKIESLSKICIDSLQNKNKILLFGNGGSAADAQHIAAELVGRFKKERLGLPAIALTTDTSIITSVGNDFGFNEIFNRQIEALAIKGDVAIGISTSGSSKNVIRGLSIANNIGCKTIALTGQEDHQVLPFCDLTLPIPSKDTARIQEMHILIGHTLCHLIDREFN